MAVLLYRRVTPDQKDSATHFKVTLRDSTGAVHESIWIDVADNRPLMENISWLYQRGFRSEINSEDGSVLHPTLMLPLSERTLTRLSGSEEPVAFFNPDHIVMLHLEYAVEQGPASHANFYDRTNPRYLQEETP